MKKPTLRRIGAFIIDMMIVSIIVSALSNIKYINPTMEKYNESYDEYVEFLNNGLDPKEAKNILNSETYQTLTYNLSYYGRYSSLISLVIIFLYFVVFQYYTNGATLGKKVLRIKVESEKGKIKFYQYVLRSLIINSLCTSTLSLLAIFILNKAAFGRVSMFIEVLEMGLLFVTFGMVIYRQDGRGLHDLIAKTKVVNCITKE